MTRIRCFPACPVLLLGWAALTAPSAAADPVVPPELKLVPADAAIFFHFDAETIWRSPIGESVRRMPRPAAPKSTSKPGTAMEKMEMKPKPKTDGAKEPPPVAGLKPVMENPGGGSFYDETVAKVRDAIGLTPDDVKAVTIFFPRLKGPGDEASAVFIVTLLKPYDRAKLVKGISSFDKDLVNPMEPEPGVFEFGFDPRGKKDAQEKGRRAGDGILRLILTDPTRIVITGPRYMGVPKASDAAGPLTPAIREAASGKTITVALNFAQFPEEIKGEDLPAEVRPFKPLIQSELALGSAVLKDGVFQIDVRVKAEDPRKAGEAEKSLGALLTLGQVLIPQGVKVLEKDTSPESAALIPVLKNLLDGLKAAKTGVEGSTATFAMKVKADIPAGTFLAALGSGLTPGSASARAASANNLKQLGLAMHNYHDAIGRFPAAAICDRKGKPLLSWRVAILPYVEQDALYREFKLDEPWDSEHNKKLLDKYPKVYAVPGTDDAANRATRYRVFTGKGCGFNQLQSARITEITDGTSNTVMIVTTADAVPWTKPDDLVFDSKADVKKLLLWQGGATQFGFFDGSVRTMSEKISETTLKALITMNGGEVVNPDDN